MDTRLEGEIEASLEKIRPSLRADGGDIRVVRLRDNGVLEVQWQGTCITCPVSVMTLRAGVERIVMQDVPAVRRVEAVGASRPV
ncbi:MAG: NifU family protein [Bacteroidota bacterium]